VDDVDEHLRCAWRLGASPVIDTRAQDALAAIARVTSGAGVDVAIETTGRAGGLRSAIRAVRAGGTVAVLGAHGGKLAGALTVDGEVGDRRLVPVRCPGGRDRMRRLLGLIAVRRVDLAPLITHRLALEDILDACELVAGRAGGVGVVKVALHPTVVERAHLLAATPAAAGVDECC
jgi:threonine dehydrogenase-like Zn-dependent dehydrogenase